MLRIVYEQIEQQTQVESDTIRDAFKLIMLNIFQEKTNSLCSWQYARHDEIYSKRLSNVQTYQKCMDPNKW